MASTQASDVPAKTRGDATNTIEPLSGAFLLKFDNACVTRSGESCKKTGSDRLIGGRAVSPDPLGRRPAGQHPAVKLNFFQCKAAERQGLARGKNLTPEFKPGQKNT